MASNQQPLVPKDGEQEKGKCDSMLDKFREKHPKCAKCMCCCGATCCKRFWIVFVIVFVLTWVLQAITYYYATLGCGPRALAKYNYPGGQNGPLGTQKTNLVPMISLLTQKSPHWGRSGFDDIPSNTASNAKAAPVGVWFRYWGPIFYTYAYMDNVNAKTIMYMRRNLLRLGISFRINRCDEIAADTEMTCKPNLKATVDQEPVQVCKDGKEHFWDKVVISEGSYWLSNRWRSLWGMQQGSTFKVYMDDKEVATAQRVLKDVRSVTFRSLEKGNKELASGLLQGRHWHGENKDEWLVQNSHDSILPYYVVNAATTYLAFQVSDMRLKMDEAAAAKADASKHGSGSPKLFLAEPEAVFEVLPSVNATKAEPEASPEQEKSLEKQPAQEAKAPEQKALQAEQKEQPELKEHAEQKEQPQQKQQHWTKVGDKYEKMGKKYQKRYENAGEKKEQPEQKEQQQQKYQQVDYEKKYAAHKMEEKYAPPKMDENHAPQRTEDKLAPRVV